MENLLTCIQLHYGEQHPLLAWHLPKSHTEAVTHLPQIITCMVDKKGIEHKGEQR